MKTLLTLAVTVIVLSSCSEHHQVVRSPRYRAVGSISKKEFDKRQFDRNDTRMMIFNASLRMSVKNADSLNRELNEITSRFEGYAVTLGYSKSTIRVPASRLNDVIVEISKLGKMSAKTLVGSDVTDDFKDYQVRLENATKARQRYLELLQKAENVEATLAVEKELERLNGEIEMMKGKMERMNHLVSFSTIDIDIYQQEDKKKPGIIGYVALYTYKGVKWLFVRG